MEGEVMRPLESLFIVALVLYTTAIFAHKFKGSLKTWMMVVFGVGLTADVSGTILLCVLPSHGWVWTFHSVAGLAALVIMTLHFTWALVAVTKKGKSELMFHKWSLRAWFLWLAAFVSGIPL